MSEDQRPSAITALEKRVASLERRLDAMERNLPAHQQTGSRNCPTCGRLVRNPRARACPGGHQL